MKNKHIIIYGDPKNSPNDSYCYVIKDGDKVIIKQYSVIIDEKTEVTLSKGDFKKLIEFGNQL
jgi:hypothetical protein